MNINITKLSLHVITFDNPFPPDYGGNQDVYYKLASLKKIGIHIILHIFSKSSLPSAIFKEICTEVYYYKKKKFKNLFRGKLPYRTAIRSDKKLITRLLQDNFPIFFEGLHCAFYANHPQLSDRIKILRSHNLEHDYMRSLGDSEKNWIKKFYYYYEAKRFLYQDSTLPKDILILGITKPDCNYYKKREYIAHYVPAFHPNNELEHSTNLGLYILIHGNLSISENQTAVNYYLNNIHTVINLPLKIAGKNPPKWLKVKCTQLNNVELIDNCSEKEMKKLISGAQILFLYTRQATGIKLKLINALFSGNHIISNPKIVENTSLKKLCHVFYEKEEAIHLIKKLMKIPLTESEIESRHQFLKENYSNILNAEIIVKILLEKNQAKSSSDSP